MVTSHRGHCSRRTRENNPHLLVEERASQKSVELDCAAIGRCQACAGWDSTMWQLPSNAWGWLEMTFECSNLSQNEQTHTGCSSSLVQTRHLAQLQLTSMRPPLAPATT